MALIKRYFRLACGLVSSGGSAVWEYKWEAVRGILYERGWVMLTEGTGEYLTHYGVLAALVELSRALLNFVKRSLP
jgi:hypothetical protein